MKIEIENLKAQMTGRKLNIYQKADALIEFNKLLDYVDELEQLTIPVVIESALDAFDRGFTRGYNTGVESGLAAD